MMKLNEMKTTELKSLAKKFHLKNWWNMKKEDLVSTIEKVVSASDEALAILNEYEKENAAIAEYTANWTHYTKRYNINEFLEKWKAGKIVLESEKQKEDDADTPAEAAPETRSEDISELDHRNNQAEPENATERDEEPQNDIPAKPKRGALIEYNGKSQNICAWAKELGVSANTLYGRIYKLGWSVEKAFSKKQ